MGRCSRLLGLVLILSAGCADSPTSPSPGVYTSRLTSVEDHCHDQHRHGCASGCGCGTPFVYGCGGCGCPCTVGAPVVLGGIGCSCPGTAGFGFGTASPPGGSGPGCCTSSACASGHQHDHHHDHDHDAHLAFSTP